jgi:hypothetical protein
MASRYTRRLTSVRFEGANASGMTIGPGEGNLTMSGLNAENAEHQPVYDRDLHDGFTLGRVRIQEGSITVEQKNEAITHATSARVNDFVMHTGSFAIGAAAAATSMDDTIWCWKMIVTYNDGTTTSTETYPKCEGEIARQEGQPSNTFAITIRNHVVPTRT